MNIIIVGYGKMGKEIETAATIRDIAVDAIIDPIKAASNKNIPYFNSLEELKTGYTISSDTVMIDFTEPKNALKNIEFYCDNGFNCVVGTTGDWRKGENLKNVKELVDNSNITMVHGSNFSTKVHITMIANRIISAMLNELPGFDVDIMEAHHPLKKDPSGTGTSLAEAIIKKKYFGKTELLSSLKGAVAPNQIMMATRRLSGVVGYHEINYTDDARDGSKKNDTITLSHSASNRSGFANGALDAVQYIKSNPNSGLVDYSDVVIQRFLPIIQKELFGNER